MLQWIYAVVLVVSIAVPLIRSFESRVFFRQHWFALFSSILVMMLIFIPWDVVFTHQEIWGFNPLYVSGIFLWGLPLEEWLFFIVIPYCVVFSYEVLRYFFPWLYFPKMAATICIVTGVALIVTGLLNTSRTYTLVVMLLAGSLLLMQLLIKSHKTWLSHYLVTFAITLFPFFIVNGVLTMLPVVWYDDFQNLGIRLGSIPIEDSAYFMAMMLMVLMVYEPLKRRKAAARSI